MNLLVTFSTTIRRDPANPLEGAVPASTTHIPKSMLSNILSINNLKLSVFGALFVSVIAVGCTASEANEAERIMAELETQMELAEQGVAEAVAEYQENRGDIKDDVRRRIEDARRQLQRAREKLRELSESGFENESGGVFVVREKRHERDRDHSGNERIRIRINGETVVDFDHHSDSDGDDDHDYDYDYDYDFDFDFDFDEEKIEQAFEKLGENIERLVKALENDSDVKSADIEDLRDLFSDEVAGMERVNINSDRSGAFGFSVTTVEAKYRGQRTVLELTVIDLGSLGGMAHEAIDMIDAELDENSDDGYVRTDEIDGYPAVIKFERHGNKDELGVAIYVGDRFVVAMKAKGTDLTEELIKDVFDDFDLDDLEDLD